MKGITIIVVSRSRSDSMVRVAITAGTEQPKPSSIGIKLLPCSPNMCMKPSITKAARAI